jgi:trehalose-6-phosphatase
MLWEYRPSQRWGKAELIRLAARRAGASRIVFVGDDATDEEAFRRLPRTARTIKVGPGRTAARERVRGVEAVDALLRALAA